MSYTWKVSAMDYNVSQDDRANVVTCVHWRCIKESGDHSASVYGCAYLEPPSGEFVEWDDITEATAVGWAKAAIGDDDIAVIEANIDAEIAEKTTPTTGSGVSW